MKSVDEIRRDYAAAHEVYQSCLRAEATVVERWVEAQSVLSANPLCPEAKRVAVDATATRDDASAATVAAMRTRDALVPKMAAAQRAEHRS